MRWSGYSSCSGGGTGHPWSLSPADQLSSSHPGE